MYLTYDFNINGIPVTAKYSEQAVQEIFIPLLKTLEEMRQKKGERILVMLAAPPGAGKSTLLSFLELLSNHKIQAIGMDGFHRKQAYLKTHSATRNGSQVPMVEIKGAPITFDLEKLEAYVKMAAEGETVGWPVYDRLLHDPIDNALTINKEIVLLEGNYLLLDEDGWRNLKHYADYTISIRADENLLRTRLIDRKMKTGVDKDAAIRFVDFSDMYNVRLCLEKTIPADLQLYINSECEYQQIHY